MTRIVYYFVIANTFCKNKKNKKNYKNENWLNLKFYSLLNLLCIICESVMVYARTKGIVVWVTISRDYREEANKKDTKIILYTRILLKE